MTNSITWHRDWTLLEVKAGNRLPPCKCCQRAGSKGVVKGVCLSCWRCGKSVDERLTRDYIDSKQWDRLRELVIRGALAGDG